MTDFVVLVHSDISARGVDDVAVAVVSLVVEHVSYVYFAQLASLVGGAQHTLHVTLAGNLASPPLPHTNRDTHPHNATGTPERRSRFYPKIPVTHKTYPEPLFRELKIGFVTFYGALYPLRSLS